MTLNQMPTPPVDMVMPQLWQAVFTYAQVVPVIIVVYLAFKYLKTEKSPLAFYFLAGGLLAFFMEPIVDVLGLVWFPEKGSWVVLHVWDRFMPAYMPLCYIWFVGGQSLYTYTLMQKGLSTEKMWQLYGVYAVINVFLEVPGLHMGVYTYYGNQPFCLFKLPLWWPVINALMPITAAAIIYRLRPFLTGRKLLLIIPLIPMADGLVNGALSWPVTTALNSGSSLLVTHIAALFTLCFGLIWLWGLSIMVAKDSPMKTFESNAGK